MYKTLSFYYALYTGKRCVAFVAENVRGKRIAFPRFRVCFRRMIEFTGTTRPGVIHLLFMTGRFSQSVLENFRGNIKASV